MIFMTSISDAEEGLHTRLWFTLPDGLYKVVIACCSFASWQIPISAVVSFVEALEVGYTKHKNPYHNLIHAADVTQTVHYLLLKTGMVVSRTWQNQFGTFVQFSKWEIKDSMSLDLFRASAHVSVFWNQRPKCWFISSRTVFYDALVLFSIWWPIFHFPLEWLEGVSGAAFMQKNKSWVQRPL